MKALIEIEFDSEDELFLHLSVIRKEIKKQIKAGNSIDDEKFQLMLFDDSNCYGWHEVNIKPNFDIMVEE